MTASARHLVSVWNPSYAADAMDATVALAPRPRARAIATEKIDEEDVYVWWGKVKSSNRQQPLPHLADILSMDADLSSDGGAQREVHLYLTDYRSLYVGHVAEITAEDVLADGDESDHVPAYYRDRQLTCDCWFRLFDIRRVIADDTVAVVEELKKLRNTRYNDRPVSIYGGMVELPLVVTRDDGARYFEADVRAKLIDGRFWVEFDAERIGRGRDGAGAARQRGRRVVVERARSRGAHVRRDGRVACSARTGRIRRSTSRRSSSISRRRSSCRRI